MEEAEELCNATTKEEVTWEVADLLYFVLTKCIASGVSLDDVERNLDEKGKKISRRPGNAKPKSDKSASSNDTPTTNPTKSTSSSTSRRRRPGKSHPFPRL